MCVYEREGEREGGASKRKEIMLKNVLKLVG